ncbi:MAG: hypothetical protein NTY48_05535 [Candidatus Diapherotrites archaeon]|nr:hypothetical protein [Candidatus Diapherotrites archaeon]
MRAINPKRKKPKTLQKPPREGTISALIYHGLAGGLKPRQIFEGLPKIHREKPLRLNSIESIATSLCKKHPPLLKITKRIKQTQEIALLKIALQNPEISRAKQAKLAGITTSQLEHVLRKYRKKYPGTIPIKNCPKKGREPIQLTKEMQNWMDRNMGSALKSIEQASKRFQNPTTRESFRAFAVEELPRILSRARPIGEEAVGKYVNYCLLRYLPLEFIRKEVAKRLGIGERKTRILLATLKNRERQLPLTQKGKELLKYYDTHGSKQEVSLDIGLEKEII